jgi:putative hydrolase
VSDNGPLDPFDGIPDPEPEDTPNQPFAGIPLFGDLSGLLGNQPGFNWDAARQLAVSVATEQKPEMNTDPLARARIEELGRLVEMQLADLTQLPTIGGASPIKLEVVTRAEWAVHTLNDYKSLLEKLNNSLAGKPGEQDDAPDAHFLDGIMQMLSPMLMVMTAGSMVGHLAARAFGDYELPIPRPRHSLRLVAQNIDGFAEQWSLEPDEVRLWQCLEQMTLHAVLGIEHVQSRLTELLEEYASNFSQDPDAMQNKIAELDVDPTGGDMMAQMQAMLGNPEVLLGAVTSPRQQQLLPEIQGLIGLVLAYTAHIVDLGGARMIGAVDRLTEAVRRHRLDSAAADQFVERLLGIQISAETLEIGNQFIAGVVERSGDAGLRRLWIDPANLPTPAEMQAPGLWLARIDLPND